MTNEEILEKIIAAYEFAKNAHEGQVRKYTGEHYIVHPVAVARMLLDLPNIDHNMVIAALLHDVVEDTSVELKEIWEEFGYDVAMLVENLTDVAKPEDGNRAVRFKMNLEHTALADPRAKTIKLADLIHNTESIVQYDKVFAKTYLKEKKELLKVLTEGDPELYGRAKETLRAGQLSLSQLSLKQSTLEKSI